MHGHSSTTLQRTFLALHKTHAQAARRFVALAAFPLAVALQSLHFELAYSGGGEPAAEVSDASEVIVTVLGETANSFARSENSDARRMRCPR